jgi:hypothetical protein
VREIPKSKTQNPNKLQIPSSNAGANPRVLEFETLEFVWDLGFGFWVFQSDPQNHAEFDASPLQNQLAGTFAAITFAPGYVAGHR